MRKWWNSGPWGWAGRALDVVYPSVCEACGEVAAGGDSLCAGCAEVLPRLGAPFCAICGEGFDGRIEGTFSCVNCRGQKFSFEFARPALRRSDGAMDLVHKLKYSRRIDLAGELGSLAAGAFDDERLGEAVAGGWPLVPVPLHWRRKSWRGFNQAYEIARPLGRAVGLPVVEGLRRTRATVTQTRLTRAQRQRNLRGAFEVRRDLGGPGVVLVDDVFTTGSTVNECARVLRRAGVQKVIVVTVMRG